MMSRPVWSFHNGEHHLLVDSKRHINLRSLHDSRPVLISYGMAELDRATDNGIVILIGKRSKINHQHRAEFNPEHSGLAGFRIEFDHIAVDHLRVATKRHRIFSAGGSLSQETAFLSCPLVKKDVINISAIEFIFPFSVVIDIS